jgi:hypothetical protein
VGFEKKTVSERFGEGTTKRDYFWFCWRANGIGRKANRDAQNTKPKAHIRAMLLLFNGHVIYLHDKQ